jgi:hypothetical protein
VALESEDLPRPNRLRQHRNRSGTSAGDPARLLPATDHQHYGMGGCEHPHAARNSLHVKRIAELSPRIAGNKARYDMTSEASVKGPARRRLVGAAMDAYLAWRDECGATSHAYRRWADAVEADAAMAWRAYEAALDREEQASVVYADLIQRVVDFDTPDRELGADLAAAGEALR